MNYYRIHTADTAYITKQPRGIFTAVGKLVDSGILSSEEEREYWINREYFEKVLPVPPYYEKNNPEKAITWFKNSCDEIPGELIYEDEFQIAVKNQPKDAMISTTELVY